jgi:gliding motility-associated-like protein
MGGADFVDARGLAITTDVSGNVYSTGYFNGRVDFDPGPAVYNLDPLGIEDLFISKLDSLGKFQWVRQMDVIDNAIMAKGKSVVVDVAGNVFVTGDFSEGSGRRCFLSKLDPDGNLLWIRTLSRSSSGTSVKVDAFGNVYIAGLFSGLVDFDPGPAVFTLGDYGSMAFISKLDASGNFIWAKDLKGFNPDGNSISGNITDEISISLDSWGNVYASGTFYGIVDFDPGPAIYKMTSAGTTSRRDVFVLKLGADGSFIWAKQVQGNNEDFSTSIVADDQGNVYTVGNFNDTADFDPGTGTFNLIADNSNSSTFILKLDQNGNFIWAKQLKGGIHWTYSATLDNTGNLYVTGYFGNTLDVDPGSGIYDLSTSGYDIFILKLNTGGDFVWARQLGGTATIICNSVAVDTNRNVYTTGYFFGGRIDFDPGPAIHNLTCGDGENIFVHKLGQCKSNSSSAINVSGCNKYILNGQTYNTSGVYTQTLTNAAGCDSLITLNLTITSSSFTTIVQTICIGQSLNGHTANGNYTDTLAAVNGCDSIITLQLTVLPKPLPNLGVDASLCAGDSLLLYPGKFITYVWQDGSAQDRIIIKKPGLYSVMVTNDCGSARDEIIIKEESCDIYFPNAFTPNNDGLNDMFKILRPTNLTEYHLLVYNRWGEKVFETFDYSKGWNGRLKGQLQSSQTFVWYCEFKRRSDTNKTLMKGIVTLLR